VKGDVTECVCDILYYAWLWSRKFGTHQMQTFMLQYSYHKETE